MWTAELIRVGNTTKTDFIIQFSDSITRFIEEFKSRTGDIEALKVDVTQRLRELNNLVGQPKLNPGHTDFQPTPTPPLPPATVTFNQWRVDLAKLELAERLVALGIVSTTDVTIVGLRTRVQSGFLAGYLGRLGIT